MGAPVTRVHGPQRYPGTAAAGQPACFQVTAAAGTCAVRRQCHPPIPAGEGGAGAILSRKLLRENLFETGR